MSKIITFVTFEHPWFPAGGIAAVMAQLPAATAAAARWPTVAVAPFHGKSARLAGLRMQRGQLLSVPFDDELIPVRLFHSNQNCSWYFLKPENSDSYFAGTRHPFDTPGDVLLRDSLFFGAAVVAALPAIARHQFADADEVEWNLFVQDWEAAFAALVFASQDASRGRLHLTLHNSYDAYANETELIRAGIDPARCPGNTIIDRTLSVIEPPAITVSEQFALDFTQDLLQREVMAPHLQQRIHRVPVIGIDNGPFKAPVVDPNLLRDAGAGNYAALQNWKRANRDKALTALATHNPSERDPVWGDKERFRRDDSPWIVMAGRDDPRQKGYDVAAAAVEDYLAGHHGQAGCAQFLFFPIPGDEGLPGLRFLETLAARNPADVLVFPFIWTAGFKAALQAAAFGLMPSLYEPFGMANEFYLDGGCVGIARATGGNLQQIVPLRAAAAFSHAVRIRANRFHSLSVHPTGILFREPDALATASADWKGINEAHYNKNGSSPSRVEQRRGYPLFRALADELRVGIQDGIRIYRTEPELYFRMLAEGVAHIQRTFSWARAGQEYARKVG